MFEYLIQGVALFEGVRMIRQHDFVGGSGSLECTLKFQKPMAKPNIEILGLYSVGQDEALSYFSSIMHAAIFTSIIDRSFCPIWSFNPKEILRGLY